MESGERTTKQGVRDLNAFGPKKTPKVKAAESIDASGEAVNAEVPAVEGRANESAAETERGLETVKE